MAVKRKARGKAERRTAPAKGSKARGTMKARDIAKLRLARRRIFRGKARVYHLVDSGQFVATTDRKGFERIGPAKGQRTTCCDQPIAKVFAVATSRSAFDPPVTNWCAGVPA